MKTLLINVALILAPLTLLAGSGGSISGVGSGSSSVDVSNKLDTNGYGGALTFDASNLGNNITDTISTFQEFVDAVDNMELFDVSALDSYLTKGSNTLFWDNPFSIYGESNVPKIQIHHSLDDYNVLWKTRFAEGSTVFGTIDELGLVFNNASLTNTIIQTADIKNANVTHFVPDVHDFGTVGGGGTVALSNSTNWYEMILSGSTANVTLTASPPNGEYILDMTTTYSSGNQIVTLSEPVIFSENDTDTTRSTITNYPSTGGESRLVLTARGGTWKKGRMEGEVGVSVDTLLNAKQNTNSVLTLLSAGYHTNAPTTFMITNWFVIPMTGGTNMIIPLSIF